MSPGSLVAPKWGDVHLYRSIAGAHRVHVGTFGEGEVGIVLESGFSDTDVYYFRVLVGGKQGWVRGEHVKEV